VRVIAALLLAAFAVPGADAARGSNVAKADESSEAVCLPFALIWRGSNDDVRDIDRLPVPSSYRLSFSAGGCNLIRESIIDWNLSFGTEATTTAALAFLESAYTAEAGPPDRFVAALRDDLAKAEPDFPEARALSLLNGTAADVAARRFYGKRSIMRLRNRLEALDHFVLLATQYLRAAEFYRSRTLLGRAETYAAAVEAAADLLTTAGMFDKANEAFAARFGIDSYRADQIEDLRMRHSVIAASLTLEPARLASAEAVMQRYDRPVFQQITQSADDSRDPICEGQSSGEAESEIAKACDGEDNFDRRVLVYYRNRASLDLAQAESKACAVLAYRDLQNFDAAVRLIENAHAGEEHRGGWPRYYDEELFGLHLARASLALRFAEVPAGPAGISDSSACEVGQLYHQALGELKKALASAGAPQSPARFRIAATMYLTTYAKARALDGPASRNDAGDREAAYLRHTLRGLDQIAVGGAEAIR